MARGLMGCVADKINFEPGAGGFGTMIFWKHVGHSICAPLTPGSDMICWPQTGQAYLNSLMALSKNPTLAAKRQMRFLRKTPLQRPSFRSDFSFCPAHIQS